MIKALTLFAISMPGPLEIGLIFLVVLLLFGAKRLPEIAKGLGQGIRQFKEALSGKSDDPKQNKEEDR